MGHRWWVTQRGPHRRPRVDRPRLHGLRPQAWRPRRLTCVFMEKFSMTGANVLERGHNIKMNEALNEALLWTTS